MTDKELILQVIKLLRSSNDKRNKFNNALGEYTNEEGYLPMDYDLFDCIDALWCKYFNEEDYDMSTLSWYYNECDMCDTHVTYKYAIGYGNNPEVDSYDVNSDESFADMVVSIHSKDTHETESSAENVEISAGLSDCVNGFMEAIGSLAKSLEQYGKEKK